MRAELRLAELSSAKKTVRGHLVGVSMLPVPGHVDGFRNPELMEHGERNSSAAGCVDGSCSGRTTVYNTVNDVTSSFRRRNQQ